MKISARICLLFVATILLSCGKPDSLPREGERAATFDPAAMGWGAAPAPGAELPIEVVDYGPRGVSDSAYGIGQVKVRFNQPVRVIGEAKEQDAAGLLVVESQGQRLPGQAYFKTPDLLVWESKGAIDPARELTARLAPFEGLGGDRFDSHFDWTFETGRPVVSLTRPYDGSNEAPRDTDIILTTSFDTDVDDLAPYVEVSAEGNPVDIAVEPIPGGSSLHPEMRAFRLSPKRPFGVDVEVRVEVRDGWTSLAGPLPNDQPFVASFKTHPALEVTSDSCAKPSDRCEIHPITLEFSTPIPAGQASKISVQPRPANFEVDGVGADEFSTALLRGSYQPGTTYTVVVSSELEDVFGQRLGSAFRKSLEFEMPPAELYMTDRGTVLDDGEARIGVSSRHISKLKVRVAKLSVDKWVEIANARRDERKYVLPKLETLGPVVEGTLDVRLRHKTEWGSTPLRLERIVGTYRGPVAVEVVPERMTKGYEPDGLIARDTFQFSSVTSHIFMSTTRSYVRAVDLDGGEPVAGASVEGVEGSVRRDLGVTDQDGLLELPGLEESGSLERLVVTAPSGERAVNSGGRQEQEEAGILRPGERIASRVVAERGTYRPGETVYFTGWAAVRTPHRPEGFRAMPSGIQAEMMLYDFAGTELDSTVLDIRNGKFWGELEIPAGARLGNGGLSVTFSHEDDLLSTTATHVRIEEYRVPDFLVSASAEPSELTGDESTDVRFDATYFSGGPVDIRDVRVRPQCWATTPEQTSGWVIGRSPGWGRGTLGLPQVEPTTTIGTVSFAFDGLADSSGYTRRCRFEASIQSASYQEEGASTSVLVHPAKSYLGIREISERVFPGDDVTVTVGAFDHRANAMEGNDRVELEVERIHRVPVYEGRGKRRWVERYEEKSTTERGCTLDLRGRRQDSCTLRDVKEGEYRLVARAEGSTQLVTETSFRSVKPSPGNPREEPDYLSVSGPADPVVPGAPASITIRSVEDTNGVVLVERFGIRDAIPFETKRGRATIEVDTDESWVPTMSLTAFAVRKFEASGRYHLESARGAVTVEDDSRRLDVDVEVAAESSIRTKVPITVRVSDEAGPVTGRVTLWAVDDAVLRLTGYRVPDVVQTFLPKHVADILWNSGVRAVLPPFVVERWDPYEAYGFGWGMGAGGLGYGGGGAAGGGRAGGSNPARSNMVTTPFYLGDAAVENGVASASFTTPDNMTAFRVIAVASAEMSDGAPMRFGHDTAELRVTAPLIARPALPRFVRPGDLPALGVVVTNRTGKAGTLVVEATVDGEVLTLADGTAHAAKEATVDGGAGAVRMDFPGSVAAAGEGSIEFAVRLEPSDGSAVASDRVEVQVPSSAERTVTETVAVYGDVSSNKPTILPVRPPERAMPGWGGVELTVTSTLLGGLKDATRELIHYPYGCVEQTSSRMLPLVALSELRGFVEASEIPRGETIDEFIESGVARLRDMQNSDGGFGYWPGSMSSVYASAYATWVLQLASKAGHPVPERVLNGAYQYLVGATEDPDEDWPDSVIYYHDVRRAIAVQVLAEAGKETPKALESLYERRAQLPTFSRAFLTMAIHAANPDDRRIEELVRGFQNNITEHPGTAHVVESPRYDLGPFFHSDLRSTAIVTAALLRVKPDHPVVPKLARGMMEKRMRGAWRNTQENAYALVALGEYANVYESVEPNFRAMVRTENAIMLDDRWEGRSSKQKTGRLPMDALKAFASRDPKKEVPVTFRRQGEGRAYYRLAMSYAIEPAEAEPIARGLRVDRRFRRENQAPTGAVTSVNGGELIAVDVAIENKTLTRYVAVEVPLPAGMEGVNLSLGSNKVLPMGGTRGWWVSHVEYHDDRVVLFADTLHPGTHKHTVYVRATTPGEYVFPPTSAEAMYAPEVFGRTGGGRLTVVP